MVFFSSRFDEAAYHASHTTDRVMTKKRQTTVPVIIEFYIPDKNKLVPDYDVAALAKGVRAPNQEFYADLQKEKKPRQLSLETGIWGYKGRIPASFIKYVYVPKLPFELIDKPDKMHYFTSKDYKRLSPKTALKYLEQLDYY